MDARCFWSCEGGRRISTLPLPCHSEARQGQTDTASVGLREPFRPDWSTVPDEFGELGVQQVQGWGETSPLAPNPRIISTIKCIKTVSLHSKNQERCGTSLGKKLILGHLQPPMPHHQKKCQEAATGPTLPHFSPTCACAGTRLFYGFISKQSNFTDRVHEMQVIFASPEDHHFAFLTGTGRVPQPNKTWQRE